MQVTNTGNVTLTGVTVVDPLTGQNISGVTLAGGETGTYEQLHADPGRSRRRGQCRSDHDIDNTATATPTRDRARPTVRVPLVYTRRSHRQGVPERQRR